MYAKNQIQCVNCEGVRSKSVLESDGSFWMINIMRYVSNNPPEVDQSFITHKMTLELTQRLTADAITPYIWEKNFDEKR